VFGQAPAACVITHGDVGGDLPFVIIGVSPRTEFGQAKVGDEKIPIPLHVYALTHLTYVKPTETPLGDR